MGDDHSAATPRSATQAYHPIFESKVQNGEPMIANHDQIARRKSMRMKTRYVTYSINEFHILYIGVG
jgi:hypothetical protein